MDQEKIVEYWSNLEPRERIMLSVGGVALTIMIFYGLIWAPLESSVADLKENIAEQRVKVEKMRSMSDDIIQWTKDLEVTTSNSGSGTALVTLVDQTARRSNINVQQWQPEGSHKVKIRLDAVSFDDLVKWLAFLHQKHAVNANVAVINRGSEKGKVDARITLEEAAS